MTKCLTSNGGRQGILIENLCFCAGDINTIKGRPLAQAIEKQMPEAIVEFRKVVNTTAVLITNVFRDIHRACMPGSNSQKSWSHLLDGPSAYDGR